MVGSHSPSPQVGNTTSLNGGRVGPSPSVGSIMSMTGGGVGSVGDGMVTGGGVGASVGDGVAFVGYIVGLFVGGGDVGILVDYM